ncbi:MAG: hypothetical protein WD535_06460 [Thermaerobacterales bacterium]
MSKWPFRKIYLYLVCLIAMLFILFGIFNSIDHFVDAFFPVDYELRGIEMYPRGPDEAEPTAEMIAAQESLRLERRLENQRRSLAQGIARLASVFFVALPVFWFHWRQTRADD